MNQVPELFVHLHLKEVSGMLKNMAGLKGRGWAGTGVECGSLISAPVRPCAIGRAVATGSGQPH